MGYYHHTIVDIQSFLLRNCLPKKRKKKVALESQFNKIMGYLRPSSSSDATSIVRNILQTVENDMLHKIRTETESTTRKHAGDKVSDQTV